MITMGMLTTVSYFLLLGFCINILASKLGCPNGCDCEYRGYNMSCSNNKSLKAFPRYMVWCPEVLIMENNSIAVMPADALTPCGDTIVNMSLNSCGIQEIHNGVFRDFYKLYFLDLRNNLIKKIHENLFVGLTNIDVIHFEYNLIDEVEMANITTYELEEAPKGVLYLNHNKLKRFEGGIPRGLEKIYLYGNNIEEIVPETSVYPLLSLDILYLNGNKIKKIKRRAFVGSVNDAWFRTEDSPLQKLQHIVLDDNLIEYIEPFAFEGLPVIQGLNMSGNKLTTMKADMFRALTGLKKLYIMKSGVKDIEIDTFRDLDTLEELNLSNNLISNLRENVFADLLLLATMNLSGNKLKNIRKEMFFGLNETKILNLSRNIIEELKAASFQGMEKVEVVDLSYNLITTTQQNAFQNMSSIDRIILDHNKIIKVEPLTFREIPTLRELSFRFNKITSLSPQLDKELNILRTDLYLRGNTIEIPEPKEIMNLERLVTMDLSHNELRDLPPGVFREVKQLFSLYLNNNKFKFLRVTALNGLRRIYELNLHENPIRCDCNMLGTWLFVSLNKIDTKLFDEDLTCSSPAKYKGKTWEVLNNVINSTQCEPLKPLGAGDQTGLFVLGPILLIIIGIMTYYTQKLIRKYIIN